MATYAILDQPEEGKLRSLQSSKCLTLAILDALHKSRLLNVEEKPFKRITKRLLAANSLVITPTQLPLTPPPDASAADEAAAAYEAEKQSQLEERRQWREDVLLDFAAFESSIVRIQFLLTSNAKERERYAAEKLKIQATAQTVRDNTADLHIQLEEAQKTLALRKTYDELAEKITSNRMLRPREDQHANLDKLNAEIADLEKESQEYAQTWSERRAQFGRIIDEGIQLRRLIRDEKEEVERREGMEEDDNAEDIETTYQRGRRSGSASPAHEASGATPIHENQAVETSRLAVEERAASRTRSPLRVLITQEDDVNMAEDGEVTATPDVAAAPLEGLIAEDREEGEQGEDRTDGRKSDRMDTT